MKRTSSGNGWNSFFEGLALGLVLLSLLIVLGRGFGPYWDTWFYHDHAMRWSGWFSSWTGTVDAPSLLSDPRHYFPDEKRHPPLLEWGGGLFNALFSNPLGNLSSARLFVELFAVIWSVASYLFLKPRIGRGPALVGVALFWGSPRFLLHAVLFAIDGLIASIYGITLLSFLFWDKGRKGKALVYGMLTLALLTKLQALFLIPILLVWRLGIVWSEGREGGSKNRVRLFSETMNVAGVVIASGLTAFCLWPALWLGFPKGLLDYGSFITHHSNIPVLYFGKVYKGPATPPWHYPLVFTLIALPLSLTVPFLVRLTRSLLPGTGPWRNRITKDEMLLWLGTAVPLLVSSIPQAPKYDGIRLLLPAYGPLSLLAALEIGDWWKRTEKRFLSSCSLLLRGVLLLALAVFLLMPTLRIYPYNIVYYSPLIGGVTGAREKGFDLDYLGIAAHRLNPTLRRYARKGDILLLAGCNALVGQPNREGWAPVPAGVVPIDFKLLRRIKFDHRNVFAIISSRYDDLGPDARRVLRNLPALDRVEYRGERLFSLHRITKDFVRSLPKESPEPAPNDTGSSPRSSEKREPSTSP